MDKSAFDELIPYKSQARVRAYITSIGNTTIHSHSASFELVCVLQGAIYVLEEGSNYDLIEDETTILNPTTPHRLRSDDPENIVLIVQFDRDYYKHYYPELDIADFTLYSPVHSDTVSSDYRFLRFLMSEIFVEYTSQECSDLRLDTLTKELVQLLFDHFHYYRYEKTSSGIVSARRKNQGQPDVNFLRVYEIVDYIILNSHNNLTLQTVAQKYYLTEAYLSKHLKAGIGLNFSEMVSLSRSYHALRMLTLSNKSIDDISNECGFSNRSHLTRNFKRWYGTSPAAYRKMVHAELNNSSIIKYNPYDKSVAADVIERYRDGF